MELYVGGRYQGKLKYVLDTHKDLNETDVADGTSCSDADILSHKIINHFHAYIKRKTDQGEDVTDIPAKLKSENPDVIIISDEIGCGIVPADPMDSTWREECGRTLCEIARMSERFERIVCGCGIRIK